MHHTIQIFIINVYWYCMKIVMFIYMKFFIKCFDKINIIFKQLKKCMLNYQPKILIINNSIINYNYCNTFNYTDISYDYIVYREVNNDKNCVLLTNNRQDIIKLKEGITKLEPCNYEFIMVLIKCDDKSYDISNILKNPTHYYYVAGANLFNENFMKWIYLYHLNITLDNPEIVIMDKSVKEFTLKPSESIILNNDNYEIINK